MKKNIGGILLLSSALLLGACGGNTTTGATTTGQTTADKEATAQQIITNPDEAVNTLANTFPKEPATSIITTSVTVAEMLKILDITPVGLPTTTHKLPEGFEDIEKVGTAVEPDIEKIVSLAPQLVIGVDSIHTNLEKKMQNTKIPSTYLPADSYAQLEVSFSAIAKALDKTAAAETYLEQWHQANEEIIQAKDLSNEKVLLLFGSGESFMLMNTTTYVGSLIEKLGAKNIITEATKSKESYVPMNMEDVVAINPSTVFIVSHGDADVALQQFKDEVKKNGAWNQLDALKEDKVAALDYSLFGYSSIKNTTEGLTILQAMLAK